MGTRETALIWKPLADLRLDDIPAAGGKAARLGHLARAGFRVPNGFVILAGGQGRVDEVRQAVRAGMVELGPGPVAVRSSGTQEDLAEASFAGQYESVLNVEGDDQVMEAVSTCWESAEADRVRSYAGARAGGGEGRMAVLIQSMVRADAAGVAYAANPLTGARDEVAISCVRGLAERLVSGKADPDEWIVRAGEAARTGGLEDAIDAGRALEIAELAQRVSAELGGPQDIEWAVDGTGLYLLQARPMTGLPEEVRWEAPVPGGFGRQFRFGEWIGDPVTPLFESWLLTTLEDTLHAHFKAMTGLSIPQPYHVVVNGWYFYRLPGPPERLWEMVRMLAPVLPRLLVRPRRVAMMMPPTAHFGIEVYVKEWRELGLPHYLEAVAAAQSRAASATGRELIDLVDGLAQEAGEYFVYIVTVAGFAAKAEYPLGRFYREHLHSAIGGSHLELLQGLVAEVSPQPHAVQSLDWYFPTLGEMDLGASESNGYAGRKKRDLANARTEAEGRVRAALTRDPKLARRFEKLLATAQRFQPLREECVAHLTRAWPVMRKALHRIGGELVNRGSLSAPDDIYFLTHNELVAAVAGAAGPYPIAERRSAWDNKRRLSPPLVVGRMTEVMRKILNDFSEASRSPSAAEGIQGVAASPGRAAGRVRILRDAGDFDQLLPGEVLVAQATTPAWTPLFARAAAVVTDTGSIGSHASQIAREYGIPAVVCTGDATRRLRPGQMVIVDGSAGVVEIRA